MASRRDLDARSAGVMSFPRVSVKSPSRQAALSAGSHSSIWRETHSASRASYSVRASAFCPLVAHSPANSSRAWKRARPPAAEAAFRPASATASSFFPVCRSRRASVHTARPRARKVGDAGVRYSQASGDTFGAPEAAGSTVEGSASEPARIADRLPLVSTMRSQADSRCRASVASSTAAQ